MGREEGIESVSVALEVRKRSVGSHLDEFEGDFRSLETHQGDSRGLSREAHDELAELADADANTDAPLSTSAELVAEVPQFGNVTLYMDLGLMSPAPIAGFEDVQHTRPVGGRFRHFRIAREHDPFRRPMVVVDRTLVAPGHDNERGETESVMQPRRIHVFLLEIGTSSLFLLSTLFYVNKTLDLKILLLVRIWY